MKSYNDRTRKLQPLGSSKYNQLLLTLFLCLISYVMYGQKQVDSVLYKKFNAQNYSADDYIKMAYTVKWTPEQGGMFKGSIAYFEEMFPKFLKDDPESLVQMKEDGCYYCALEIDDLHARYNAAFTPVSTEVWYNSCPLLYVLMELGK